MGSCVLTRYATIYGKKHVEIRATCFRGYKGNNPCEAVTEAQIVVGQMISVIWSTKFQACYLNMS
jgi:hypothetical protein